MIIKILFLWVLGRSFTFITKSHVFLFENKFSTVCIHCRIRSNEYTHLGRVLSVLVMFSKENFLVSTAPQSRKNLSWNLNKNQKLDISLVP
jgi:hypothetical protein